MSHRQPMSYRYQNPSGLSLAPNSYQQEPTSMINNARQPFEPIPMVSQHKDHSVAYSNSFKTNRVAPQQPDYNTYTQPSNSFRTPSTIQSTKALMKPSQGYSLKQLTMDTNHHYNSNQPYYAQNKYMEDIYPYDDLQQNDKPVRTSWCSQPLCLGLTRLTGGILFGTMIVLGTASIAGLIASVLLYIQDSNTNSQWKVLGIVVCCIMLITIFITLCIFIYCYKHEHIRNNDNRNNFETPHYNQENGFGRVNHLNRSYDMPPLPYEMIQSTSPLSTNEDVVQVEDKQTNTEATMAPLRPRDCQRGVWPARNAYGGLSYRPLEKPKMIHHHTQTISIDVDQMTAQRKNNVISIAPRTIAPLSENYPQHDEEQYPRRFIEQKSQYDTVEKHFERPLKGRSTEEYEDFAGQQKNDPERIGNRKKKEKYNKVSIKRVKAVEEPNVVQDDFNTDHFYQ